MSEIKQKQDVLIARHPKTKFITEPQTNANGDVFKIGDFYRLKKDGQAIKQIHFFEYYEYLGITRAVYCAFDSIDYLSSFDNIDNITHDLIPPIISSY